MTITAPKIIAGLISALLGFTALTGPQNAQSSPPSTTLDVTPYLIEPTTTTSSTLFIDPYASAPEQFAALGINLGWPKRQLAKLTEIIARESMGIPQAHNQKDPMGGSYGLMQINGFWCRGENSFLQQKNIVDSCEMLLDPQVNLLAGLAIWHNSRWNPWGGK